MADLAITGKRPATARVTQTRSRVTRSRRRPTTASTTRQHARKDAPSNESSFNGGVVGNSLGRVPVGASPTRAPPGDVFWKSSASVRTDSSVGLERPRSASSVPAPAGASSRYHSPLEDSTVSTTFNPPTPEPELLPLPHRLDSSGPRASIRLSYDTDQSSIPESLVSNSASPRQSVSQSLYRSSDSYRPRYSTERISRDFQEKLNTSAARIQRWWRAKRAQEEANRVLIRDLLDDKRKKRLEVQKTKKTHKAHTRRIAQKRPDATGVDKLESPPAMGDSLKSHVDIAPPLTPLPAVEDYGFTSKLERLKAVAARRRAQRSPSPAQTSQKMNGPDVGVSLTESAVSSDTGKDKLNNLLSFLDEVEESHQSLSTEFEVVTQEKEISSRRKNNASSSSSSRRKSGINKTPVGKPLDEVAQEAHSVTDAILNQRKTLKQKAEHLRKLQESLERQRAELAAEAESTSKREELSLETQREEYEATIQRHLSFIDQLIEDKKELSAQCEKVVKELKAIDKKNSHHIKSLKHSHAVELKKQKEIILSSEKTKREKWVAEQSKKIKELTVKGLEPEIERLVQQHKATIHQLKEEHSSELRRLGGDQTEAHHREIDELKSQMRREIDDAIDRTREECRQRYLKQLEEEQREHHDQRRELLAEIQMERGRNLKLLSEDREALEAELRAAREQDARSNAALREDTERLMEDQQRRHENEMRDLKEQLAIEKESWEDMFMRKQAANFKSKEESIRENLRLERDREIEMVIDRLETEATKSQRQMEAQLESRMMRYREKYDAQLVDIEKSEQASLRRHNECKQRLAEAMEELATLRGSIAQKTKELDELKTENARLNKERDNVAQVVRVEFEESLASNEYTIETLRRELSEHKAQHRHELAEVQRAKDTELDNVHDRVRAAISKKDETIKSLREQFESAALRANHLEELLDRQRQQIL